MPNNPTADLSIAHPDGVNSSEIGPIILTTPEDYLNSGQQDHNPNATCWEILTLRLGRFAREYIEKHGAGSLTDEMLQVESRRILYSDDDPWNQTAADNPEWLNLFKKAHGIDSKAPVKGTGCVLVFYSHTDLWQVSTHNKTCSRTWGSIQVPLLIRASTSTTFPAKICPKTTHCEHSRLNAHSRAHWVTYKAMRANFRLAAKRHTVYPD